MNSSNATDAAVLDPEIAAPTRRVKGTALVMPALSIEDVRKRDAFVDALIETMTPGVDYDTGETFGSDSPSLLKAGAEKLQWAFGLRAETALVDIIEDWSGEDHEGEPIFYYRTTTGIFAGDDLVAIGVGSCSTRESRHRYRWVREDELPAGVDPSDLKSRTSSFFEFAFAIEKKETTGQYGKPREYWQRFEAAIEDGRAVRTKKKVRSGAEYDGWEIVVTVYRVPNENVPDVANSCLKMAKKRSYVDGIITATGTSGRFTQDVEDLAEDRAVASGSKTPRPKKAEGSASSAPKPSGGAGGRKVDQETGEVTEGASGAREYSSAEQEALDYELEPAAWGASGLVVSKERGSWRKLGDADIETLRAFADIDLEKYPDASEFVELSARVLGIREREAKEAAA